MTGSHRIKGQLSYQTPSFYALFLVIVASVALGQSSAAQQVPVVATTKTAIAARGQREAKDINYGVEKNLLQARWDKIGLPNVNYRHICDRPNSSPRGPR